MANDLEWEPDVVVTPRFHVRWKNGRTVGMQGAIMTMFCSTLKGTLAGTREEKVQLTSPIVRVVQASLLIIS